MTAWDVLLSQSGQITLQCLSRHLDLSHTRQEGCTIAEEASAHTSTSLLHTCFMHLRAWNSSEGCLYHCVCVRMCVCTFRSKCVILLECRYWTPSRICLINWVASSSLRDSFWAKKSNSSPPDTLQHTHTLRSHPVCSDYLQRWCSWVLSKVTSQDFDVKVQGAVEIFVATLGSTHCASICISSRL